MGYAAVVLAAGSATRMGRLKQLEPAGGRPLVRWAVEAALAAGLDPVVVVTGAAAEAVAAALADLPARIVYNPDHPAGMGGSLAAGVSALGPEVRATVVLLGDQPLVPPDLLRALVRAHDPPGVTIVRPGYPSGRLAPPALFDRRHFPELAALTGDRGASVVIARHPDRTRVVPWPDDLPLLDVDTPDDLETVRRYMSHGGSISSRRGP